MAILLNERMTIIQVIVAACIIGGAIDVYETEGTGKDRTQRIVIYYRFVGYIELPESALRRGGNYKANTRQGVEVEYIPQLA